MLGAKGLHKILEKHASDVVIVSSLRTPVTRAKKGGLSHMYPEELLGSVLDSTLSKTNIGKGEVRDVLVGTVLQALGGQKTSAMAVKHVGLPPHCTVNTVNRQCASSAQAIAYMANTIRTGSIDCGIAAGTESMTMDYFPHRGIPNRVSPIYSESDVQESRDVLMPMGVTSENVAKQFGISRHDQDEFALQSHERALAARDSGHFSHEISPVNARQVKDDGTVEWKMIDVDDGIRQGLSLDKLSKLPLAFDQSGTTTAGNISDGASATLLMTRAKAESLRLEPIAKYVHSAVMGVPAHIMGTSTSAAVIELLRLTGLDKSQVDIYEMNEAFASQSLYCIRELGVDQAKLNPFGGAIALGHPLGATGGRMTATLLNGLRATNGKVGVLAMCASTGQGFAGLFVRE